MSNKGFNGSTIVFASATIGSLRGIKFSKKASGVPVTASSDTEASAVAGIPKSEISADVVGGTLPGVGSTGALAVTWNSGETLGTLASAVCLSADVTGSMDGEITGTCTFEKSAV